MKGTTLGAKAGQIVGGFELERRLGVGGMAAVWLAHPVSPSVPFARVVLKQMHPHLAEHKQVRELFLEEARLALSLDHPNVIRVIDCGEDDGECFIAMEYIDGVDLKSALAAHDGPLWPALAAALIAQACKGLHYAHRRGVVHRDVSPDNLMVDRKGQVRLLDFGVARAASTELTTRTGLRKGKVRYMAPEYIERHQATPGTDVYAMGLTLHELLTGRLPFDDAGGVAGVYAAILRRGIARADALRPSLPASLVNLVARATALDPRDRFETAAELEAALEIFLKEFKPPPPEVIGEEVVVWKQKLAAGPLRPGMRSPGSFGQLESTEFIKLAELAPSPKATATGRSKKVQVAHALDDTQAEIRVDTASLAETDPAAAWEAKTDPSHRLGELPSVMLSPELEAVAVRKKGPKRKKKRRSR